MKRVVVTGMAGITSLGSDWASIEGCFTANRSGIRRMDEWDRFTELNTRLAGPIDDFTVPAHWPRKQLRSMGRVSRLAVGAAEQALLAGGAEELCPTEAMVFDALYATSLKNDAPHTSPRPYDSGRDGLVIGEGGGMLVLEELEHALARGARIHAEIVGFGSNADGVHTTRPEQVTMRRAMELALGDANLPPEAIGYVNGHGTATEQGDIAETLATHSLFGSRMPISSQKSFLGHTLGACGALESWFSIEMMNRDRYIHTLNLDEVDERCGELDYLQGEPRRMSHEFVMNNNFAFGGVNTSLILRRWS